VRVVRAVRAQFVRGDHRDDLIFATVVPSATFRSLMRTADLRADDDIVGRDDAGEDQFGGRPAHVHIGGRAGADQDHEEARARTRFISNTCIKQVFD